MNVNEIWCSHFDEQMHLDQEDKVDTSPEHLPDERRMTNFDKLLEDPESRELIIENTASRFCFNMDKMIINRYFNCDECELQGKDCVSTISEWLHKEYIEGGEE